jgi:hypothetical protein
MEGGCRNRCRPGLLRHQGGRARTTASSGWSSPHCGSLAGSAAIVIGLLGRYGDSQLNLLPEWIDLLVVVAFNLLIFGWAVRSALSREAVAGNCPTKA